MRSRNERRDDLARWERWLCLGMTNGWSPPDAAIWFKRLPGIRFVRACYHYERAEKRALEYRSIGIGLGHINPYDLWVIEGVRDGWV